MNRNDYYFEVEKLLKRSIKLPCACEVLMTGGENQAWVSPLCCEPNNESEFRFMYVLNNINFYIHEKEFDKYYNGFVKYDSKLDVEYRPSDIDITVNNLAYIILNNFQKTFLVPCEQTKNI